MRVVVSALVLLAIAVVIGCDNDDNTVDPIPKFHKVFPAFYLKIDNGFREFGVDSALVTVDPDIGWLEPQYTDERGFIGMMDAGTFITGIDTTYDADDSIVVETTSVVFGFNPSQEYRFAFSRSEPFVWRDSFRAVYAVTVDSQWILLSADTLFTTPRLDPEQPIDTVLYKVQKNPPASAVPPPDQVVDLPILYGWWFDSSFVVTDSAATALFPPDSFTYDTTTYGYWYRVDSFYLPPEESLWCDVVETKIIIDTIEDVYNNPMYIVDTQFVYGNCDPVIDSVKRRIYQNWAWGTISTNGDPLMAFDTTIHFTYPDTAKALAIDEQELKVYTLDISFDMTDTQYVDTSAVDIYFIRYNQGDTTMNTNLVRDLTMPPVEVFPSYKFMIRQNDQ